MNEADHEIESLLQTVAPLPPSGELRERVEAALKPTIPTSRRIGVAALIATVAAAIALVVTQLPNTSPKDDGQVAEVDENRPLGEPNRGPGALGPWLADTPEGFLTMLSGGTDVILYGKPQRAEDGTLRFTVHEVLRGKLRAYRIDATQDARLIQQDLVHSLKWPLGEMCCVYLTYNEQRKVYELIEHGRAIHTLPWQEELEIGQIRDIVHVWDTQFDDVEVHNYFKHAASLGEREKLVLSLIFPGPDKEKHRENMQRLKALPPKTSPKVSMPFDVKVTGVREGELEP